MMRSGTSIAFLVLLVAGLAPAQAQPAAAASAQMQLALEIDPAIAEPLRSQLKAAIAAELDAKVLDAPAPGVGTLRIARGAGAQLQLSYRAGPAPIERSVPWSADPQAAIRDVALMAANLVRDQTLDLLPTAPAALPAPAVSPPGTPGAPAAPRAVAPLDGERPPDFAPPPPPEAAPPPPRNRRRVQLLAVVAPQLASGANVDGQVEQRHPNALGLQGRCDLPVAPRLSVGAGFGLYEFAGSDEAQPLGGPTVIEVNLAMDASAWLRAYLPISAVAELYLAAGVGPSLQNSVVRKDSSAESTTAPPAIGLGASLLVGTNLLVASHFGLALELGALYHLMRSRQAEGSWLVFHALNMAVQLGVLWVFDG